MGVAEIIALITGFFTFFKETSFFIKKMQNSPEEDRAKIMKLIMEEKKEFQDTGRPTWGD